MKFTKSKGNKTVVTSPVCTVTTWGVKSPPAVFANNSPAKKYQKQQAIKGGQSPPPKNWKRLK